MEQEKERSAATARPGSAGSSVGSGAAPRLTCCIRLRIGHDEAHYAGNLVDGARMLQLFGDVATELCIRGDGEEGLFRAYESIEFLAPVRGGDYVEVRGTVTRVGRSSRAMEFTAHKVIEADPHGSPKATVLEEPMLVCKARGTCVVGK